MSDTPRAPGKARCTYCGEIELTGSAEDHLQSEGHWLAIQVDNHLRTVFYEPSIAWRDE